MVSTKAKILNQVIETFSLDSLHTPVNLNALAEKFGVSSIEVDTISSEAILVPLASGYKIILKKSESPGNFTRQRFSLAHELGHLLLREIGYGSELNPKTMHRNHKNRSDEEQICDQIAAEILMPRVAFTADASVSGWSLGSLDSLAKVYGASVPATARRMVDLMPETSVMGIWKPSSANVEKHRLQQSYGTQNRYAVPNSIHLPRRRLWLIARAANGKLMESGPSPILDRNRPSTLPNDVPAEAWAWGRDEFRRVLVFYYPERELTNDMLTVSNATGRPL